MTNPLLEDLDPEQRQVAEALSGPVVVLAGAGTGKTRAITHRMAYAAQTGRHDPARTLAVTFTTRAAGEMSRRLAGLGVNGVRVRTFHSAALRQLRWAWPDAIGGQMFDLIASKSSIIAAAASGQRIASDPSTVRDLATEIEWAKAVMVGPEHYQKVAAAQSRRSPGGLTLEQAGAVYSNYERLKRDARKIDFEDVLLLTAGVLEEREDLRRKVQASFAHFTVDEFQDVSGLQQRLLRVWLGDRDDLCVVGDVAQTIYSFAGANPAYLQGFTADHPGATTIALTRCYRCTPEIVEVAEHVLAGSPGTTDVRITGSAPRGGHVRLRAQNPSGPTPSVREFSDEPSEAAGAVEQIAKLIADGTSPREIAILVRINAVTEQFESALADAGIPYTVRGGRRFFERPEVRRAVSLIRGAARASATAELNDSDEVGSTVRAVLASTGWSSTPPSDVGAVRESWESLSALVTLADEVVAAVPGAGLRQVIDELDRREAAQDAPSVEGVTLASLHAAKGMEWDAVFLVGLVDGVMPMSHAVTVDQVDEERRLLYVGVTRARTHLFMSWALARIPGGRNRRPSRFLVGMTGASGGRGGAVPGPKRGRKSRRPARCRICGKALVTGRERSVGRCRTCPGSINDQLLERLRDWRTETVAKVSAERGKSVPAYVVATDATLEALAELVPQDEDSLAAIPGLGPMKLRDFGEELLQILRTD